MPRTIPPLVPVAVALAMTMAACSDDGDTAGVATLADNDTTEQAVAADVDPDQALLDFAECMRNNGVPQFPDPEPDDDGNLSLSPARLANAGIDRDAALAARDTCAEFIEELDLGGGPAAADFDAEAFLDFAQCMRAEGIDDFPDPGPNGLPNQEAIFALDLEAPAFQAAAETCIGETGFTPSGS